MKIGIITQYYKSQNYGGNLQAFALCHIINKLGFDAEQICYGGSIKTSNASGVNSQSRIKRYLKNPLGVLKAIKNKAYSIVVRGNKSLRRNAFQKFNLGVIKHSVASYTKENIYESNNVYDLFITGSDQVWNTRWYNPVYFLDFVKEGKIKMSYAASISKFSLTDAEKEIFGKSVNDYLAVSVRESSSVELLQDVIKNTNVEWCLDPTLILDLEDWEEITTPRIENERYILGFFISGNKKFGKIAKKFAQKKGLKYIEIPVYEKNFHFRERRMYDVGPSQFLSFIKYADHVFTDSFHASVFSIIFDRAFFVFSRNDHPAMKSRLVDLTALFDCQSRLCDSDEKCTFSYLETVNTTAYMEKSEKYFEMKEKSIAYLKNNIIRAASILDENKD